MNVVKRWLNSRVCLGALAVGTGFGTILGGYIGSTVDEKSPYLRTRVMYIGASSVIGAYIGGVVGITLPITVPAYVISDILHKREQNRIREQNRQKYEEQKKLVEKFGARQVLKDLES